MAGPDWGCRLRRRWADAASRDRGEEGGAGRRLRLPGSAISIKTPATRHRATRHSVGNAEKLIRDSDVVIEFTTPRQTTPHCRRIRKADSNRHHGALGRGRCRGAAGVAQSSDRLGTQYEPGHQSAAGSCRRGRPPPKSGLGRRNHGDAPSGQDRCAVGHGARPRSCGGGRPQGDVRRSSAAR